MTTGTELQFTAAKVRRDFLDFFVAREHREVRSGPVFPQDDPTLLFTNAGMNQFKDVFLGTGSRDYARAVDTQKCIRAGGKHNDLEDVGYDTYHHTFFEMLGNWSFGDYFKEEAIVWAWDLLTNVWKLPKERLWATVFAGDEGDGTGADEEAERIWREKTDIDPSHILRCDKSDNFWEMGATGPCGPCSEIHIDRGGPDSDPRDGADPKIGVNAGNERFIELWNLVFMQFNRQDDGSLVELPAKSVDTGMGFERILSVLQGKSSNYDTDLFTPIFDRLTELTGKGYQAGDEDVDVAFRVCADHVRAVSTAFADGALPSNEGRGYVLRRLIRRASRFGRQTLGQSDPFLFELVNVVADVLGAAFPEVRERLDHIRLLVRSEEEAFGKTLDRGLGLFEKLASEIEQSGAKELPGKDAYELYATYGFPEDLVELMARERGLSVDRAGWDAAQEAHRSVSRSAGKFKPLLSPEKLSGLSATQSTCHAAGADGERLTTTLQAAFAGGDGPARLVLEGSPFYPEGGGQVGDIGTIAASDGSFRFTVEETQKLGDVIVHVGKLDGNPTVGAQVEAAVDAKRRAATRANHTGTHLLHAALRRVLGDHVTQQGSYVGPDRLRFDLSHPKAITSDEIAAIEADVNAQVFANHPVVTTIEDPDDARARGVMALFGEKYGERVRVVDVGGTSTELCGGTHVAASGEIGPFVIVSERAIQAGVRRIEALTQSAAFEAIQAERRTLQEVARTLKVGADDVSERVEALQKELKAAKKKQKQSAAADVGAAFRDLQSNLQERGGVRWNVVHDTSWNAAALRELGDRLRSLKEDLLAVLVGKEDAKIPFLVVSLGAAQKVFRAGDLAKTIAGGLGGGGGGRPDVAQGQGTKADALDGVLSETRASIEAGL